mmetsp:Transcript_56284/g.134388  ORF Transcript_56284/g.134388 Transcript_56284/m.134388 type:complete len:204 (+) Transcript_56284:367-978(+)
MEVAAKQPLMHLELFLDAQLLSHREKPDRHALNHPPGHLAVRGVEAGKGPEEIRDVLGVEVARRRRRTSLQLSHQLIINNHPPTSIQHGHRVSNVRHLPRPQLLHLCPRQDLKQLEDHPFVARSATTSQRRQSCPRSRDVQDVEALSMLLNQPQEPLPVGAIHDPNRHLSVFDFSGAGVLVHSTLRPTIRNLVPVAPAPSRPA